jgi:hypothetical protein
MFIGIISTIKEINQPYNNVRMIFENFIKNAFAVYRNNIVSTINLNL